MFEEYLDSFNCIEEYEDDLWENSEDELEHCKVGVLYGETSRFVKPNISFPKGYLDSSLKLYSNFGQR